jgi:hypothetical protein
MSKMSRGLLDSMDRFALRNDRTNDAARGLADSARGAVAGSR